MTLDKTLVIKTNKCFFCKKTLTARNKWLMCCNCGSSSVYMLAKKNYKDFQEIIKRC